MLPRRGSGVVPLREGVTSVTMWEQKKARVLEQYARSHDTSAGEQLLTLRQDGSMRSYCREFIALASNAPEVPDRILEMAFMIMLKSRIRAGAKMFEPNNFQKMMEVAKMVEDWNEDEGDSPESNAGGTQNPYKGSTGSQSYSAANGKSGNNSPNNNRTKA